MNLVPTPTPPIPRRTRRCTGTPPTARPVCKWHLGMDQQDGHAIAPFDYDCYLSKLFFFLYKRHRRADPAPTARPPLPAPLDVPAHGDKCGNGCAPRPY